MQLFNFNIKSIMSILTLDSIKFFMINTCNIFILGSKKFNIYLGKTITKNIFCIFANAKNIYDMP